MEIMELGVIGIGRIGLCFALNLEKAGFNVIGYDIRDDGYMESINDRTFTSPEKGVNELIQSYTNFKAVNSLKYTIENSDLVFVVLRTESDQDGKYNHSQIESLIFDLQQLGYNETPKHIVICSNVQPGYTNTVAERLKEYNYIVSFNPETIAQGQIVHDQVYPSIVIIGEDNPEAGELIASVYEKMCKSDYSLHRMHRTDAELTKVGLNCSLTAKISMANTIGDIAIRLGANPDSILDAIGSDDRIGNKYFKFGYGYGGPCFPRDNRALIKSAEEVGIDAHMCKACDKTNKEHLIYQLDHFASTTPLDLKLTTTDVTFKKGCPNIEESQQLAFSVGVANMGYDVTIKECEEVIEQVKSIHGNLFKYETIKD